MYILSNIMLVLGFLAVLQYAVFYYMSLYSSRYIPLGVGIMSCVTLTMGFVLIVLGIITKIFGG